MIVGLGKTGISCARYFARHGIPFSVMDHKESPPGLTDLHEIAPDVSCEKVTEAGLMSASEIVLSPGVPRSLPAVQVAIAKGVPVTGDIAMFSELADAPVIVITGSNGKSTVTAMVGAMAQAAGVNAGVGGNIGTPCLDLLEKGYSLYVIEASSYQLETALNLKSKVAVVLNLTPDHLDRYPDAETYFETKANVYRHCEVAVLCRDVMYPFDLSGVERVITFGSDEPTDARSFGVRRDKGELYLCQGDKRIISVNELPVRGGHNYLNALASLSIGSALDWDFNAMTQALRGFSGLPHRCEVVATIDGVTYINDSKSTNPGSAIAAVEGLAVENRPIHLILGGQDKGADFGALAAVLKGRVVGVLVYGVDRDNIARQISGVCDPQLFETLADVVTRIKSTAKAGELALLSPGCASLDQFKNFEHRGEAFRQLVLSGEESS
ncbi:MAG: UDP-N-acetylmuramoyl-L-alanine--D-glutamate ligase [Pseudomonadales bacterium]